MDFGYARINSTGISFRYPAKRIKSTSKPLFKTSHLCFSWVQKDYKNYVGKIQGDLSSVQNKNLSAATSSFDDTASGSSFVFGNKMTGIPLALAYSAPPQPASNIKWLSLVDMHKSIT